MPTREQLNDPRYATPKGFSIVEILASQARAYRAIAAAKAFNASCQKVQDVCDEDIESISYSDWVRSHFEEERIKIPFYIGTFPAEDVNEEAIKVFQEKSRKEAFEQRIKNDAKRTVKL